MRLHGLLFVALAACSSKSEHVDPQPAPVPVVRAPDPIAPLFERVLPGGEDAPPLIGPGGSLYVGARRWSSAGRFLGRHSWAIAGQARALAVVGTVDRPLLVAIAWGGLENLAPRPRLGDEARSFLLVAAPGTTMVEAITPINREFYDGGFTVSPNGTVITLAEGNAIVARALPSLEVIAHAWIRTTDVTPVPCWVDDARIAWTSGGADDGQLNTLAIATNRITSVKLATAAPLVCDPAGGAAAMVFPDRVALIDLATAAPLATAPLVPAADGDDPVVVAVGQRGARLAIATQHKLAIFHRDGTTLSPLYTHALPSASARMAFTQDGTHLAVATTGLTVFGPPAEAHHGIAPRIAFDLPEGFTARAPIADDEHRPWEWSQLAVPPSLTAGTALLVDATAIEQVFADVTAIAIPREELAGVPAQDATDEQIAAFAKTAMPQLFEQWANAKIETDRDAEFTLRTGTTKGMPWFETRELWRDGCEPYDGYTRVVVDRDAVFVVRALVPPAGSIKGWLEKFFDLPFGHRVQLARRRGPDTGPC